MTNQRFESLGRLQHNEQPLLLLSKHVRLSGTATLSASDMEK